MTQDSLDAPGLGALFDLSFTRFITVSVIKIIYLLGMLAIALVWLFGIIAGFTQGFLAGIGAIILFTILAMLWLLFLRVWLELIVVLFRIGENTTRIARAYDGGPTGGFPVQPPAA